MTLEEDNILWLRGRVHAGRQRSLSEALDGLVTAARRSGRGDARSVVGTLDIAPNDPALLSADDDIRGLFRTAVDDAGQAPVRKTTAARRAQKAGRRG